MRGQKFDCWIRGHRRALRVRREGGEGAQQRLVLGCVVRDVSADHDAERLGGTCPRNGDERRESP